MDPLPPNEANRPEPFDRSDGEQERPRLRLQHLFVLTAVMALLLAIDGPERSLDDARYEPAPLLRNFMRVFGILHTLLEATALTAFGYGVAWYRRGLPFFNQPGHWLLFEISLTALIGIVPSIWFRVLGSSQGANIPVSAGLMAFAVTIYSLLTMVFLRMGFDIYVGKKKCAEAHWKSVFYAKALATLLLGIGGIFIVPITIRALRIDRREHIHRDGSNWCGAWIQIAVSTLSLAIVAVTICNMITVMGR